MLQVQLVLWEGKCGGEGDLAAVWTTATAQCLPPLAPLPQEIEDDRGDIDALFAELDVSLEQSRKV